MGPCIAGASRRIGLHDFRSDVSIGWRRPVFDPNGSAPELDVKQADESLVISSEASQSEPRARGGARNSRRRRRAAAAGWLCKASHGPRGGSGAGRSGLPNSRVRTLQDLRVVCEPIGLRSNESNRRHAKRQSTGSQGAGKGFVPALCHIGNVSRFGRVRNSPSSWFNPAPPSLHPGGRRVLQRDRTKDRESSIDGCQLGRGDRAW